MEKVNIVSCVEKEKKDKSGKYFVYKAADGRELFSKQKFDEGEQEFLVTPSKDGRSLWIKKGGEYGTGKPAAAKAPKAEKGPLSGKSNEIYLLGNSLKLAKLWIEQGLVAKPKSLDELDGHIRDAKVRFQKML